MAYIIHYLYIIQPPALPWSIILPIPRLTCNQLSATPTCDPTSNMVYLTTSHVTMTCDSPSHFITDVRSLKFILNILLLDFLLDI